MSEPASISAGIAQRYAAAIFEIVNENNNLSKLETGLNDLETALNESAEFRDLMSSPMISRADQEAAIGTIGKKMGLPTALQRGLSLMAQKRRLFVVPALITALRALIADARGEVTADVTSATPLSAAQADKLAATLSKSVGKTVTVNTAVDEALIGGLVVKVGSKMIDTSIRSKLASLQNAMKEVG